MTRAVLLVCGLCMLCSCGIRRPLIRPSEIPAYEAAQKKKREKLEREAADYPDTDIDDPLLAPYLP